MFLSRGRPMVIGNADLDDGQQGAFVVRLRNRYLFGDGFEIGSRARWGGWTP